MGAGFYVNPIFEGTNAVVPVVRDRWSSLRVDKQLFIQRGRKLIRDTTSLHFVCTVPVAYPVFKKDPRANINSRE